MSNKKYTLLNLKVDDIREVFEIDNLLDNIDYENSACIINNFSDESISKIVSSLDADDLRGMLNDRILEYYQETERADLNKDELIKLGKSYSDYVLDKVSDGNCCPCSFDEYYMNDYILYNESLRYKIKGGDK